MTDLHLGGGDIGGSGGSPLDHPDYDAMPGLDFSHPGVIENDKDLGLDWIDSNEARRSKRKKRAVSAQLG